MLINAGDTRSRNLYRKLVQKTCTTNVHENLTQDHHSFLHKNNGQPITLHGSCHVLHSFRRGIELSSYAWSACKKLVPEKNLYKIDRHTCKFLVQRKFLVDVSWAGVSQAWRWRRCSRESGWIESKGLTQTSNHVTSENYLQKLLVQVG